jgi:hypothetical protein
VTLPRSSSPPLATERVVLGVVGDDAQARVFVAALLARATGAHVVLEAGHFVGDDDALKAFLDEQPRDAWVLTVGAASARVRPTFLVGLGGRHEMAAVATDLWLGQSSEVVAGALVEALLSSTKS